MRTLFTGLGALCAVALLAVPACGDDEGAGGDSGGSRTSEPTTTTEAATGRLGGTAWILTGWSEAGTPVDAATARVATLVFAPGGDLSGSTGCNNFAGLWTEEDDRLTLALGPMTQMACEDADLQAQESMLVRMLPSATGFQVDDAQLQLSSGDGQVVLRYAPQPTDLAGTPWKVTGVNNGRGGIESSALTEALTATFGEDGRFSADGGCNQLTGSWSSASEGALSITDVGATMMACDQEVMDLEARYTAALESSATYVRSGDALALRDDRGAMTVTFTVAPE